MSKPEPQNWYVELTMDHANRLFAVRKILPATAYPYVPPFYVLAVAHDEIGAYNETAKALDRLGFKSGDIPTHG